MKKERIVNFKTKKVTRVNRNLNGRDNVDGWIFMLPMLILLYLFVWRSTVMGGVWSFFKMKGFTPVGFAGMQNYKAVLTNTNFLPILGNTVEYVIWSFIVGFLPPLFIAIALNEVMHFKNGFRVLIYLPAVVPGIVVMVLWQNIFKGGETGLLNMLLSHFGVEAQKWLSNPDFVILGIIIATTWSGCPGTMLLYYAALQGVSVEVYEAAIIDGAGPFRRLWHVTRPAVEGLLLLQIVRQIISIFQILDQPMQMTGGGPNGASTSLSYQLYQYAFNSGGKGVGQAMALGTIIFLILLLLTLFYFVLNKKIEDRY